MAAQEQDLDAIAAEILAALDGTLDDFIVARETEGQALKALIEQRLEGVTAEVVKVRSHMPEILQWQRERLVAKLEDAQVQLENNRLEQELVLLAQRIDVAEELDRLEAHVKETYNILKKKEAVGRRGVGLAPGGAAAVRLFYRQPQQQLARRDAPQVQQSSGSRGA